VRVVEVAEVEHELERARREGKGTTQIGLDHGRGAGPVRLVPESVQPGAVDVGAHEVAAGGRVQNGHETSVSGRDVERAPHPSGLREQARGEAPLAPVDEALRAAVAMAKIAPPVLRERSGGGPRAHAVPHQRRHDVDRAERSQRTGERSAPDAAAAHVVEEQADPGPCEGESPARGHPLPFRPRDDVLPVDVHRAGIIAKGTLRGRDSLGLRMISKLRSVAPPRMRLLVVEDDNGLRGALRDGLRRAGYAVDDVPSAEEALDRIALDPYDLLVLDLGLPGADGLALLGAIRERGMALPVLVLTARGSLEARVTGLDSGADDYLAKPFAFPELLARVRALLRRGEVVLPSVLRVADVELDPARLEVKRGGAVVPLTAKEFAILEYLMRHARQLVTRTMLLESCWGASYEGLSNLVDVNLSRLRCKLDAAGGPPLLHTIRGAGVMFEDRSA
jgi:two-component system copper resistance phosphate regulon response regulator CusR